MKLTVKDSIAMRVRALDLEKDVDGEGTCTVVRAQGGSVAQRMERCGLESVAESSCGTSLKEMCGG